MGKTIPKAKVEFMRADGDGKPINYFTVELENVMISTMTPNSGDSGVLEESVHGPAAGSKARGWSTRRTFCLAP